MHDNAERSDRLWERLAPLILVACVTLAYANTFSGPFIFDDAKVIIANPKIRVFTPPWSDIFQPCRWFTDLTFAANYAMGGFNVADYHAGNLLIHALATLTLFGVARRTLRLPGLSERFGRASTGIALTVAALWGVHPLQTESVTYLCQRSESLMGFLYLLTLYLMIRGAGSKRPVGWYAGSVIACAAGMGAKEVMVTAPIVVFAYDGLVLAGSFREAIRRRWGLHLGLAATWLVLAYLMWLVVVAAKLKPDAGTYLSVSGWQYLASQFGVITRYLWLSFVPHPLCLDYCLMLPAGARQIVPPMLLVGGLGVATLVALVRWPAAGFLGVWFFGILAPTSSVVPVADLIFEHRMYLPLAAVLALAVVAVYRLSCRIRRHRPDATAAVAAAVALAAVAAVGAYAAVTHLRNRDYQSEERMWRDVMAKRPENLRVYIGLSRVLMQKGSMDEAESVCHRLLARLPDLARVPDADLPKDPTDMRVASHHDWLLYVQAHNNLGLARMHGGHLGEAQTHYREALRVYPRFTLVRNNLAYVLFRQGETNAAVAEWRTVMETAPADPEAHYMLGGVAESRGAYAEAVQHYLKALAQRPAFHTRIAGDLAWLLATCPDAAVRDGRAAVALAEEVVRVTGTESPRAYDVLGAALAEAGRHPEAMEAARRAVQLLEADPSAGAAGAVATSSGLSASAVQARLRQYERGESFHIAAPAGMTAP